MKNKKFYFLALIFIIFCFFIYFYIKFPDKLYSYNKFQLGTSVHVKVLCKNKVKAQKVAQQAFAEIERIENLMSPYRAESDISKINSLPANQWLSLNPETYTLLEYSKKIAHKSHGAFDPTFASIAYLWNWKDEKFKPPLNKNVYSLLPLVNSNNILLKDGKVSFNKEKMKIGLGGIAKGYALEQAAVKIKKMGCKNFVIEAGGDLQAFGTNNDKPWLIGLQHPRKNEVICVIELKNEDSVVTSGDYERFTIYQGKRYHHIIDPRTGYPAESGLISVTVLAKSPVQADAWATAFFVLGLEESQKIIKKQKDLEAIFITKDLDIYLTNGIEISYSNYELKQL